MSYKATNFDDITAFSNIALHVARESNMHVSVSEPGSSIRNCLPADLLPLLLL